MSEEEYWESNFEDDEFGDTFLHEESSDDDINLIMIPKIEYDIIEILSGYIKSLKRCKTTDEAMEVMIDLYGQIRLLTIIESEQAELQNRVQSLEHLMKHIEIR